MSKITFYILLAIFSLIFLSFISQTVKAQIVSPSPIGDFDISQTKTITISDLIPNKKYFWQESQDTGRDFTIIFSTCLTSDGGGKIEQQLGPFDNVRIYKLELYEGDKPRRGDCNSQNILNSNPPKVSETFSVGGGTGQACCVSPYAGYDTTKDECAVLTRSGLDPNRRQPTKCPAETFCDPLSNQCFKTKPIIQPPAQTTKPCKKEGEPFDPTKDVKCTSAGGIPCDTADPKNPGFVTAIGCIHTSPAGFVKDAMKFIIAISGGLAFLLMLLGAFQMITSAGNPETLQAGRERFNSAIIGLLIVILAVLFLKIIGVDILGIPDFTA